MQETVYVRILDAFGTDLLKIGDIGPYKEQKNYQIFASQLLHRIRKYGLIQAYTARFETVCGVVGEASLKFDEAESAP